MENNTVTEIDPEIKALSDEHLRQVLELRRPNRERFGVFAYWLTEQEQLEAELKLRQQA